MRIRGNRRPGTRPTATLAAAAATLALTACDPPVFIEYDADRECRIVHDGSLPDGRRPSRGNCFRGEDIDQVMWVRDDGTCWSSDDCQLEELDDFTFPVYDASGDAPCDVAMLDWPVCE